MTPPDWIQAVEPVEETWTEVRITGQPDGPFPPYDFTFRSDRPEHWTKVDSFVAMARERWDEVTVRTREMHRATWTSEWEEWS